MSGDKEVSLDPKVVKMFDVFTTSKEEDESLPF